MSAQPPITVSLVALGCPKNLVDSEYMLGVLAEQGFEVVEEPEAAKVIIVNTCAFIRPAEEEAIEALLDMAEYKQNGRCRALICTGCLSQRRGEELASALPEVDGFLGIGEVPRIAEVINSVLAGERVFLVGDCSYSPTAATPRWRSGPSWLAYLRIADGCSHHCTFCTIPRIRGTYRSRPAADLVGELEHLVADGVREVCLIAQDTTAWGRDLPGQPSLPQLLRALGEVPFEGWLRLLYLHPEHTTEAVLEAMAEVPQIVPYVDIPLQHASSAVLQRMGRRGGADEYLALLATIRNILPGAAIRSTFITGFPGETEEEFAELLAFLEEARLDRVSAFRFWCEEDTAAGKLPDQVPEEVAEERLARLMETQEAISYEINQGFVDRELRVLVERHAEGVAFGRSYRDAPEVDAEVRLQQSTPLPPLGEFIRAKITMAEIHDLQGVALAAD